MGVQKARGLTYGPGAKHSPNRATNAIEMVGVLRLAIRN